MSNNDTADLSPYIASILQRFKPATDASQATHILSTKEVAEAINELNPACSASPADTFQALSNAGFIFSTPRGTVGIHFKWLMIEK